MICGCRHMYVWFCEIVCLPRNNVVSHNRKRFTDLQTMNDTWFLILTSYVRSSFANKGLARKSDNIAFHERACYVSRANELRIVSEIEKWRVEDVVYYGRLVTKVDFLEQNQFNRLQMVQFECTRFRNPLVSSTFEEFPFPISWPCCFLPSCLPIIKKWFIMGGWV